MKSAGTAAASAADWDLEPFLDWFWLDGWKDHWGMQGAESTRRMGFGNHSALRRGEGERKAVLEAETAVDVQ